MLTKIQKLPKYIKYIIRKFYYKKKILQLSKINYEILQYFDKQNFKNPYDRWIISILNH